MDDAGEIVGFGLWIDVVRLGRMQHRKLDAVPNPALTRNTAQRGASLRSASADNGIVVGQRRRQPRHWHRLQQRQGTAAMIHILVAHYHAVELRDARSAKHRSDDAVAGVRRVVEAWTGVVE